MSTINLPAGSAFMRFSAPLGDMPVVFKLRWSTRYGYYSVDMATGQGRAIALGRALHPGIDLLAGLNSSIGSIVLHGSAATIENLGIANSLRWYKNGYSVGA